MKLYDCDFSEKAVKELHDYRNRQEDVRLKPGFTAILSVVGVTQLKNNSLIFI